jgi:hypothetical protein
MPIPAGVGRSLADPTQVARVMVRIGRGNRPVGHTEEPADAEGIFPAGINHDAAVCLSVWG